MYATRVWSVMGKSPSVAISPLDELPQTESEEQLEDVLTSSPELLERGLSIVGRQVQLEGGCLDLLGVDGDGRLVVFELKRGKLTRDAVAQALDYASDLATYEVDQLSELIEGGSGRGGVPKVEHFGDWYDELFPTGRDPLGTVPRIVLVGLGVDGRARRMVRFLKDRGVDIELLTFAAFRQADGFLLTREADLSGPRGSTRDLGRSKANLEKLVQEAVQQSRASELFGSVREALARSLGISGAPGKGSYSYYLQERTDDGRLSLRCYCTIYVTGRVSEPLVLCFYQRTLDTAGEEETARFKSAVPGCVSKTKTYALEVAIDATRWPMLKAPIESLLAAAARGWREQQAVPTSSI